MQTDVRNAGSTIRGQLTDLRIAFQNVVRSADMRGGAKDAFDGNVVGIHIPILNGLEELYHELNSTITSVIQHVRSEGSETATNGVVSMDIVSEYLDSMEQRDGRLQEINAYYQARYNVIEALPAGSRPDVSMPNRALYNRARNFFQVEARNINNSLENLSITITSLEELIRAVGIEIGRVGVLMSQREENSDWSIPMNSEFVAQMDHLRRSRQRAAFAVCDYTIFGTQGGWCEFRQSYFDDRAFYQYLNITPEQRQALVDELLASFKDEDGNWDIARIGMELFSNGADNGFTTTEWYALIHLLGGHSWNSDEELEFAMSFQEFVEVVDLARLHATSGDAVRAVLYSLSDELSVLLADLSHQRNWMLPDVTGMPSVTNDNLHDLLRRTQLCRLLSTMGIHGSLWGTPFSTPIDWDNFLRRYEGFNWDINISGEGVLRGRFALTEALGNEMSRQFGNRNSNRRKNLEEWMKLAFETGKFVASFIPKYGKIISISYSVASIGNGFLEAIRNGDATQDQINYANWRLYIAMGTLGASIAAVETDNGFEILTIGDTSSSVINMAGLAQAGYPPELVMAVLMSPYHPDFADYFEDIADFLDYDNDTRLRAFERELERSFERTFDSIEVLFPEYNLTAETDIMYWPPRVLNWVIQDSERRSNSQIVDWGPVR